MVPINKLVTLFYPNRCICCGKIISQEFFCKNCENLVMPISVRTCKECGLPFKDCGCDWNFYYFKEIVTCFENADDAKASFYGFKFRGNYSASDYFVSEMAKRIKSRCAYVDFDYICAVPTHKSSVRDRGYDQTAVLAKKLSKKLKIPFRKFLFQTKLTEKQHDVVDYKKRYSNVKNKYNVRKEKHILGKTILLVDDIKTTGATLSECARELMLSRAEAVYAVTALVTYPKRDKKDSQISVYEDDR